MSAMGEIKLKSSDLLFSGRAITDIILECVPEVLKPAELASKDVDFLLAAIRVCTYGSFFEIDSSHNCTNAKSHSFTVSVDKLIAETKYLEQESLDELCKITMDNGQVVQLRPIVYRDIINMLQNGNTEPVGGEEVQKVIINNMSNLIESVDGVTNTANIRGWLEAITPDYVDRITDATAKFNDCWGISFKTTLKCAECNSEYTIDLPVDPVSFFSK